MGCLNVGVVGTGLIGGSIALAGIRAGYRVFAYESGGSAVHTILGQAIRATDLANLAESSDLVFIATPISVITDIAKTLASGIRPGSLVSDVASVKGPVFRALSEIFGQRCFYIPSHPMAGSEKSGLEAARVNLFEGAVTLLCPDACSDQSALERLSQFWKRAGSSPLVLDVPTHDRLVAAVSHLPHLLAAILMLHATRSAPEGLSLSGGGFRDSTRIAAGSPDLWKEILLANRSDLLTNLYRYRGAVDEAIQILEANDAKRLQALLDAAKTNREKMSG